MRKASREMDAAFACRRLDHCTYGEQKIACKDCPTHCYAPKEREAIREVMRWSRSLPFV